MNIEDLTEKQKNKLVGSVIWFIDESSGNIITGIVKEDKDYDDIMLDSGEEVYDIYGDFFLTSKGLFHHLMKTKVNCDVSHRVNFMKEVTLK